jgi:hypothetical protein
MTRRKTDPIIAGRIRQLLDMNWSYSMIKRQLLTQNIKVSKHLISDIKNPVKKSVKNKENKSKINNKQKVLNTRKLNRLSKMAANPNPPTQTDMAKILGCSQPNINYHLNKKFDLKLRKKSKVHVLTEKNIATRRARAFKLYRRLNKDQWKKVITTDEAWFYTTNCNGKRRIQYVSRSENSPKLERYQRSESHAKGFMVWAGVSYKGKTSLHFVDPGAKINSQYYCNNVLKNFLARDVRKLYPNGDYLFHQDSAPSHVSNFTRDFMSSRMKFITKEEWIPKSPDAAPMDYSIWGNMKRMLWREKVEDMASLKRAIRRVWRRLPQELINNTLKSWPKRLNKIYNNKGKYIE